MRMRYIDSARAAFATYSYVREVVCEGFIAPEMMRKIILPLFLSLLWSLACSQQTFPYVSFMGQTLANHSYVNLRQVGSDGSGIDNVQCHTDLSTCCSRTDGLHRGDWYFPNGTRLPFSGGSVVIGESRGNRAVFVRRSGGIAPSGIYRCDFATVAVHHPNNPSVRDTVYLGLYFYSSEGTHSPLLM